MTGGEAAEVIAATQRWLERFVIGLGLCPFAAAPFQQDRITYAVCDSASPEAIYTAFLKALGDLVLADPSEQETALLILSHGPADFGDYLDRLAEVEQAVVDAGLEGVIQVASFHPEYRFRGAAPDDAANYSNRSPFPMFHLIREEGLAEALTSFHDPEGIPERNIRRLREMGLDRINKLLKGD